MTISLFLCEIQLLEYYCLLPWCVRVCVCMSIRKGVSVCMFVRMSDSLTDHTKTVGKRPIKFNPILDYTNCNPMTCYTMLNLMTLTFFLKIKYSNLEHLGSGNVYLANGYRLGKYYYCNEIVVRSCNDFYLIYFQWILVHSKGHGQSHAHFDCEYLANGDR